MKKLLLFFGFALFTVSAAIAQRTITGTVTDQEGEPLIGAAVQIKDTDQGVVTDFDGNYTLNVPSGRDVLLISYVGYETQEYTLGASNVVNITLAPATSVLDEVVVVGYNAVKKSDVTSGISTVDGEALREVPLGNFTNTLQGQATGLQIVQDNGAPGAGAYIKVRGQGSIGANTSAIFIVDNVQVTSGDYNALNPNDIEEVTVLKDAAATAIYGARASNGVVLVTTKKGNRKQKPKISYDFQYGEKTPVELGFDLMDKNQKLDYEVALGARSEEEANNIRNSPANPETDWEDVLLGTGLVRSHNVSISGGSEVSNYFFSFNKFDEGGVSAGSLFDRITGRGNMEFQAADWLKIGTAFTVSNTQAMELRDRFNVQNPFYAVLGYNPYEAEFQLDENGDFILDDNGNKIYNLTQQGFSISEAVRNNPEDLKQTNFIGDLNATATILPELTFTTRFGGNYRRYSREYYIYPGSILDTYVGSPSAPGIKTDNGSDRFLYNWNNVLNYSKTFSDVHNVNVLLGTEYYFNQTESYSVSGRGFPSSFFTTQDNASEITTGSTGRSEWALWSQLGEIRYNYNEKYYGSVTVRRDGSSRFGSDNKFGVFWAASAAWNLANEDFMAGMDYIDQLKLRVSYGVSGNEPGSLYWLGSYAFGTYNDLTTSVPSSLTAASLKWEENTSYSVGLDFGIWNNRLSGSIDYYNRVTSDLLFPNQLSRTTGWTSQSANVGEIENSGVELELRGAVIRNKDVSVNLWGNITTNKNQVNKLANDGNDIIGNWTILREGLPINTFYLVRYAGVDPATGNQLYYDVDGNLTDEYSTDDAVALDDKATLPKYFGAFGIDVNAYGFDLRAQMNYTGGNYTYNFTKSWLQSDGDNVNINQDVAAFNYWKEPGDTDVLPRPDLTNNINDSDRYLQKADYMRLRNVSLGYTLPSSLTQKAKISSFRVFVQGTNLFIINPYFQGDPEVGRGLDESGVTTQGEAQMFTYRNTQGWTVGANVTF